jgi:tetratricopeptide (TPR) repeat protein
VPNPVPVEKVVAIVMLFVCGAFPAVAQISTEHISALNAASSGDRESSEQSFQYARQLVQEGQYALAAQIFELLVRSNPELHNISAELGVLYLYQLSSPYLAQENLTRALNSPDLPLGLKPTLERYLGLATDMTKKNTVSFSVGAGYRSDDNVNASPSNPDVLAFGFPAVLSDDALATKDDSFALSAGGQHAFWFGGYARHNLMTDFDYYLARLDQVDAFDIDQFRVRIGPDFALGEGSFPRARLRVFAQAAALDLGGDKYIDSTGGGTFLTTRMGTRWEFTLGITREDREFFETATRVGVDERDGDNVASTVSLTYRGLAQWYWRFGVLDESNDAVTAHLSYDRSGGFIRVGKSFPMGGSRRAWTLGFSAYERETDYRAPDLTVNPYLARLDSRTDLELFAFIPVTRSLAIRVGLDSVDNESNLPNTIYENTGSSLTLLWYH